MYIYPLKIKNIVLYCIVKQAREHTEPAQSCCSTNDYSYFSLYLPYRFQRVPLPTAHTSYFHFFMTLFSCRDSPLIWKKNLKKTRPFWKVHVWFCTLCMGSYCVTRSIISSLQTASRVTGYYYYYLFIIIIIYYNTSTRCWYHEGH